MASAYQEDPSEREEWFHRAVLGRAWTEAAPAGDRDQKAAEQVVAVCTAS